MARKRITTDPIVPAGGPAPQARRSPARTTRPQRTAAPSEPLAFSPSESQQPQAVKQQPQDLKEYEPSHEEVARLAFSYWEARGGHGGSAEEDWLRAEKALRSRTAVALV